MSQKRGCLGFLLGNRGGDDFGDSPLPYRVRDDFLSSAEFSFFNVLKQIYGERYTIFAKVSLKDIFLFPGPIKI